MAFSEQRQVWDANLCIQKLQVAALSQQCICNAFEAAQIALITDKSRMAAQKIDFPKIEIVEENVGDSTTTSDIDKKGNDKSIDNQQLQVNEITGSHTSAGLLSTTDGNSFVWIAQSTIISMLCISGMLLALKSDRKDTRESGVSRTSPSASISAQNHFIEEVAKVLEEPYAQVAYRQASLIFYRTIFTKSLFPHLLIQMHPLLSPFTSYEATQSRLMRLATYIL